jgi:DNA-binding PadR family transcriptional regulator
MRRGGARLDEGSALRQPGNGHGHGGGHRGPGYGGGVRRGEVRNLLLAALLEAPAHGYELMGWLEERSGGRWRPSPGSVYPLLQVFEDEGLAKGREQGGRKVFALTEAGRAQADRGRVRDLAADPAARSQHQELRAEVQQLHLAARQVGAAGSPAQLEQAVAAVRAARQALYRLLAE